MHMYMYIYVHVALLFCRGCGRGKRRGPQALLHAGPPGQEALQPLHHGHQPGRLRLPHALLPRCRSALTRPPPACSMTLLQHDTPAWRVYSALVTLMVVELL